MTNPSTLMGCPNPSKYPDCPGHDPRKCSGHKQGRACGNYPIHGSSVCRYHGGAAPRVKNAAAVRVVEEKVRRKLGRVTSLPVENPLEELSELAGKAKAWMATCEEHMAELERLRYSTEGGEHIRGEVVLFERAVEQCRKILVDVARLDIDARLARIGERQVPQVSAFVDGVLRRVGVDPASPAVMDAKSAEVASLLGLPKTIEGSAA